MALQETVTNAIASLSGTTSGVLAALVAVAVLWLGADDVLNALDFHLPLRQLMFRRNWNMLAVDSRFVCTVVASYMGGRTGVIRGSWAESL